MILLFKGKLQWKEILLQLGIPGLETLIDQMKTIHLLKRLEEERKATFKREVQAKVRERVKPHHKNIGGDMGSSRKGKMLWMRLWRKRNKTKHKGVLKMKRRRRLMLSYLEKRQGKK
jgi:hypothetical protein